MANFIGRRGLRRNRANSGCAGCFLPIIGLIFLGIGYYLVKDTLDFLPGTVTAQGTIIHCSYDNEHLCNPTVQFKTQSGQSITIGSSESSSDLYEGKEVQVRYHAKTPQDGRMDSFIGTWMFPLICVGAGLLVFFAGISALLRGIIRAVFVLSLLLRGVMGRKG